MSALRRTTPGAQATEGTAPSESRLGQLRRASAGELRRLSPPETQAQLLREWKLLMQLRVRALEGAALAQLRKNRPALETDAALDDAVELAIGAAHFTWRGPPFTTEALTRLQGEIRCGFRRLRESLDRLVDAGRVHQEQLATSDGSILFVWKRGTP